MAVSERTSTTCMKRLRNRARWAVVLTRFMRSLRSVISFSRDVMILLMSLIRGPKLASSLSSLDFSCTTQRAKKKKINTVTFFANYNTKKLKKKTVTVKYEPIHNVDLIRC